jgi:GNAT superfamily N-acetyltransferase
MIRISHVDEKDLPGLSLLYQELIDKEADPGRMLSVFRAMQDNPHYHVLVAKEHGRVLGSVMGVLCLDLFGKCDPFMVVENMIVSEPQRGSGIGALLMQELEAIADKFHCNYMMLVSSAHRKDAHSFYERNGFDQKGVRGFKKYLHRMDNLVGATNPGT